MKTLKQTAFFALVLVVMSIVDVNLSAKQLTDTLTVYPQAQAIVGRPLTPVSVAGVTRRTVRRCAVGVYNCQHKVIVPSKVVSVNKG